MSLFTVCFVFQSHQKKKKYLSICVRGVHMLKTAKSKKKKIHRWLAYPLLYHLERHQIIGIGSDNKQFHSTYWISFGAHMYVASQEWLFIVSLLQTMFVVFCLPLMLRLRSLCLLSLFDTLADVKSQIKQINWYTCYVNMYWDRSRLIALSDKTYQMMPSTCSLQ